MPRNVIIILPLLVFVTLFSLHQEANAQLYLPVGPQTNVPVATVTGGGWTECFRNLYTDNLDTDEVLSRCPGDKLMLACRATGSGVLTLLGQGDRGDVKPADPHLAGPYHLDFRAVGQPLGRHREERRTEEHVEPVLVRRFELRRQDARLPVWRVELRQEGQSLEMIPVVVGEEHRQNTWFPLDRGPETNDARAGVERQCLAGLVVRDLDAWRVAAVADGSRYGPGNGPADTPESHFQGSEPSFQVQGSRFRVHGSVQARPGTSERTARRAR